MYRTISIVLIFIFSTSLHSQRLDVEAISSFEEFRYRLFDIAPDGKWYIILENDELLTSTDEGENWTMISYPDTFDISSIKYFDNGELLLRSAKASILGNDSNWKSLPSLDGFSLIQVHNDTIYCTLGNEIFMSTDKGESVELAFTAEEFGTITNLYISQSSFYVIGTSSTQSYFRYDMDYIKIDSFKADPYRNFYGSSRLFDVNQNDEVGLTTFSDTRGQDGGYLEWAYGVKSIIEMHGLKVHKGKVYFTYNRHGLGVYDLETEILDEYIVDQMGEILIHEDKIFIADQNRILEVSEFVNESGQIKEIIPNLKRTYNKAETYEIDNDGTLYANTGNNLFVYNDISNQWRQIDLENDNIIDITINAEGTVYALSETKFHIIKNKGQDITTKPFNDFLYYTGGDLGTQVFAYSIRAFGTEGIYIKGRSTQAWTSIFPLATFDEGATFHSLIPYLAIYSVDLFFYQNLGSSVYCQNGLTLGSYTNTWDFVPLWDNTQPEISALSFFEYSMNTSDSTTIYLYPTRDPGFIIHSTDLGKSWIKNTRGPHGTLYKGSQPGSSWILQNSSGRIFYREQLDANYVQIDNSTLPDVRSILSDPSGTSYFQQNNILYKVGEKLFHKQRISGRVFLDENNNCLLESGEEADFRSWSFRLIGNNYSAFTFSTNGEYNFDVPVGTYTLDVNPPSELWNICDTTFTIEVTDPNQEIIQNIGVNTDEVCVDLEVFISSPTVKRCKINTYYLTIKNTGTEGTDNAFVDVTPDSTFNLFKVKFLGEHEELSNGKIRLYFGGLEVLEEKRARILFEENCTSELGQRHCVTAEGFSDNICTTSVNTSSTEYQNNIGPFDPNDMRVFNDLGFRALNFKEEDEQIYHVRFQNTGTDTAENVEVVVSLDDSLDLSTLQIIDGSHDYISSFNDVSHLVMRFDNIMLPDSFVNEPASNGYFRFKIKPFKDVIQGQAFNSYSDIYFDFNRPIRTNKGKARIGKQCGPPIVEALDIQICSGESYSGYTNSGYYQDMLTSSSGCDSLRKIELTRYNRIKTTLPTLNLCEGESFRGQTTNTTIIDSLTRVIGCDSIVSQRIIFHDWLSNEELKFDLCPNDTILGYHMPGIYIDTLRTSRSCQLRIVELAVPDVERLFERHVLCTGESLGFITEAGVYMDTIRTIDLCDSLIIERDISFLDPIETNLSLSICENDSFDGYTESGIYQDTFTSVTMCDSIRIIDLRVLRNVTTNIEANICEGEQFLGYSESGVFEDIFHAHNSCDSIRILHLTVSEHSVAEIETSICEGDSFNNYTISGIYIDTLTNYIGCDSIRVINLDVVGNTESEEHITLCPDDSYEGISEEGIYEFQLNNTAGCDSTRIIHLTSLYHSASTDTIYLCPNQSYEDLSAPNHITKHYINQVGCDSIHILYLVEVDDDAGCVKSGNAEFQNIENSVFFNLFPNPASNLITLQISQENRLPAKLFLYNSSHDLVLIENIDSDSQSIDITSLSNGVYHYVLKSGINQFVGRIVVIN